MLALIRQLNPTTVMKYLVLIKEKNFHLPIRMDQPLVTQRRPSSLGLLRTQSLKISPRL
jgi:hypothetical protein